MVMDLMSPVTVRRLMQRYEFKHKKRLGQNFLVDRNIALKILAGAGLDKQDTVLEIGPGLGTLTREMAARAGQVIAIEIDRGLLPILEETLAASPNVQVVTGDALKIDLDQLVYENTSRRHTYKLVANLPYYITSPLVMHLLENKFNFSLAVVMVQSEVARRMVAGPGTKDYGALSVAVQFYVLSELLFPVSPNVFVPRPEVASAVVRLTPRQLPPVRVGEEKNFFALVRAAFGQRRKTILNALSGAPLGPAKDEWAAIIKAAGLSPAVRGESLGLDEFAALTRSYEERSGAH